MARLGVDKQEKFANYLANGYTQMAAYKAAGYTCKNSTAAANASKLANSEDVLERIKELEELKIAKAAMTTAPPLPIKKEKNVELDLDWFNKEYVDLLAIAKKNEDVKNAVSILKDMAELNKIRPEPEPQNTTNNNRMLPSNDKLNMGGQVKISVFDKESTGDGGTVNGFVEITIPDPDTIPDSDYATYEDIG
jgi:phage terminase small subunit